MRVRAKIHRLKGEEIMFDKKQKETKDLLGPSMIAVDCALAFK
jgi:hypothetical protein